MGNFAIWFYCNHSDSLNVFFFYIIPLGIYRMLLLLVLTVSLLIEFFYVPMPGILSDS